MFDVTSYGATGDGVTDDRLAIQDAIDAAATAGGGVVYFPKGVYFLDSFTDATWFFCLNITTDNITLQGEGRGISVLKMPNVIGSPINFGGVDGEGPGTRNCAVKDLEVDGGWNLEDLGSQSIGIRAGSSNTGLRIQNVYIHSCRSYGIGLQRGSTIDCLIENVTIEDTGGDGIDVKNVGDLNRNNRGVNITVRRAGLRSDVVGQACVDIRGIWNLSNIICLEYDITNNNCQAGIRFRPGESTDSAGYGAHKSTLTNFYCEPSISSETIGVQVNAYQVSVSGGQVVNCHTGVVVTQQEATISGVIALGCNNGFMAEDGSGVSNGDRIVFSGCIARGSTDSGFKVYTDNCVLSCIVARSNVHGVNLRNGSVNTVISGVSSSNSGNNLNKQSAGLTWTDGGFVY